MVLGLLAVNLLTFLLYALDKRAARRGGWRVPEATLLLLGFLGGTPAALLAQQVLRHKNRKRRFQWRFWGLTLLQGALWISWKSGIFPFLS